MRFNQSAVKWAAEYHENERKEQAEQSYCFLHGNHNCICMIKLREEDKAAVKRQYEEAK